MKNSVMLTITSLLTILFLTFHFSDEITRGMEPGRLNMVMPVLENYRLGLSPIHHRRRGAGELCASSTGDTGPVIE